MEVHYMFENYSDLVSIEELCEMLFIGKNVAYELLQRKKIKAFRIGRLWKIQRDRLKNISFLNPKSTGNN